MATTPDKRRVLLTENQTPNQAVSTNNVSDLREKAIETAKIAVEHAFNTRGEIISSKSETDKAVEKFLTTPHQELVWLSRETSLILSSQLAVSDEGEVLILLSDLSDEDNDIIRKAFEKASRGKSLIKPFGPVLVGFDKYKNFEFCMEFGNHDEMDITLTFGNRVASTPPEEARHLSDVKVESKGKEILIGDRIKLEKDRIQSLVQPVVPSEPPPRSGSQPRQKVSGRNAYEIRADILENAIDIIRLSSSSKISDADSIAEEVLNVASKLYTFVEHKN